MRNTAMTLAALVLLGGANCASAADMPLKAPPAPAVFGWGGWYGGINGGYGWADPEATITPSTVPLPAGGVLVTAAPPFTLSTSPQGGFVGGQLGYNWQINRTVVGLELDAQWANLSDTATGSFINLITIGGDAGRTLGTATLDTRMNGFGTLRARFGYAFDRVLPYATVGVALAHVKSTVTVSGSHFDIGGGLPGVFVGSFGNSAGVTDWNWGIAVGGGVDYAIDPRWVIRGEYLFLGMQDSSHGPLIPGVGSLQNSMDVHLARFAINYRLNP